MQRPESAGLVGSVMRASEEIAVVGAELELLDGQSRPRLLRFAGQPRRLSPQCSTGLGMLLLQLGLLPLLGGRRRLNGWRRGLQPCGCWLVWRTSARGQG